MRKEIIFYINGVQHQVQAQHASMMLAEYLRYEKNLVGTKIVCAEGDCGACTVLRYFPLAQKSFIDQHYLSINSCITTVAQLDGSNLITIEGLQKDDELHSAQSSMMNFHASQCGFCTPGFVMALAALVEEKTNKKQNSISESEAKNALTGNLCRCTGYESIIKAATHTELSQAQSLKARYNSKKCEEDLLEISAIPVLLESDDFTFYAPTSLQDALQYFSQNPGCKIIAAGTDLGVLHNKRKIKLKKLLSLHLIPELYSITFNQNIIHLGARVTLNEFRHFMKNKIPEVAKFFDIFASPQIKNMATIIGNIANASPIGDSAPVLLALDAQVEIKSLGNSRVIPLADFFIDYKKTKLLPHELISGIHFKLPHENHSFKLYKSSIRKDLDISAINFAISINWTDVEKSNIDDIKIAVGGVAATPIRLSQTETYIKKTALSRNNLDQALQVFHSEFKPISDLRASSAYRRILVEHHFIRALAEVGVL